jgi:hypothetical protein
MATSENLSRCAGEACHRALDPVVETRRIEGEGAAAPHGESLSWSGRTRVPHAAPTPSTHLRLDHRVKRPVACLCHSVGEVFEL